MILSRGARAAARSSTRFTHCQPRRFDSHSTGHGESAFNVAGGSGNESLGVRERTPMEMVLLLTASQRGFYITLTLVPLSMVAYALASSSDTPVVTRIIDAYRSRAEEVNRRNTLHQTACEQAAIDRQLFFGEKDHM